jgi:hypothetical protein
MRLRGHPPAKYPVCYILGLALRRDGSAAGISAIVSNKRRGWQSVEYDAFSVYLSRFATHTPLASLFSQSA